MNGRIDLTQAEAVADMIASNSAASLAWPLSRCVEVSLIN